MKWQWGLAAYLYAYLSGSMAVHLLSRLPQFHLGWVLGGGLLLLLARGWRKQKLYLLILCVGAGFFITLERAHYRLSDTLSSSHINKVTRVHAQVISLPLYQTGSVSFNARVLYSHPDASPKNIRIVWRYGSWQGPYASAVKDDKNKPDIKPGQVWHMALVLKPIYGLRNPGGFDYEAHRFAQGIRATGTVRGIPEPSAYVAPHSLFLKIQQWRNYIRRQLAPYLEDKDYGGILPALAIGDQTAITSEQWRVFSQTGITHLVSISGTHVTLVAGLIALLARWLWCHVRWRKKILADYIPAQLFITVAALLAAALYCALAGWGIPAQRTFFMLLALSIFSLARLNLSLKNRLLVAAFVVVLIDPWAPFSVGFWLSFGAIAILLNAAQVRRFQPYQHQKKQIGKRLWQGFLAASRIQLIVSIALLPALALFFQEVSLISPVVNAYAIPMVGIIITPLALLSALLSCIPALEWLTTACIELTHGLLLLLMWPTHAIAQWPLASIPIAKSPLFIIGFALAGVGLALGLKGLPLRFLMWLWILPALLFQPSRPEPGYWQAVFLDVGQASAILVQTARHALLFDTGVRHSIHSDSAHQVIVPYMQGQGINKLDILLVSHDDMDHAGGLTSLLTYYTPEQSYASFSLQTWIENEAKQLSQPLPVSARTETACQQGQKWEVDGVHFELLWPEPSSRISPNSIKNSKQRNQQSCVLSIQGKKHALLLTGDISSKEERSLVTRGLARHDMVVAAHHGSNSSSSADFIHAVQADHVVIQAAAFNTYGHPHRSVLERWKQNQVSIWRTDTQGAISAISDKNGLLVQAERLSRPKYWQF